MRVAQLTPQGRGGVALVALSGPGSEAFLDAAFDRRGGAGLPQEGRPVLGILRDALGDPIDEVLLVRAAPDRFELGCHGGPGVVAQILEVCRDAGAEPDPPGDWEQALANTLTELGCQVLLAQRARLPAAARALQAALSSDPAGARAQFASLLESARLGRALVEPPSVALIGAPNVGKSSLMNRLLGHERVLVSDVAGTTRDAVEALAILGGVPVRLVDTAGRREAASSVEASGIALGVERSSAADARLAVLDGAPEAGLLERLLGGATPTVWVLNKVDVLSASERAAVQSALPEPTLEVSALTGKGVEALVAALRQALVGPVDEGGAVLYSDRQVEAVRAAQDAFAAGDVKHARELLEERLVLPLL